MSLLVSARCLLKGRQMGENRELDSRGLGRRELIKRGAIMAGIAVWGVPLIKMAVTDDLPKQHLGGATLAALSSTCGSTLLEDPTHTRLVCAKSTRTAVTAFEKAVNTACIPKCAESTTCGTGTCKTPKRKPATTSEVTCVETFNPDGCPGGAYARGAKEFTCTGVVTCNCACR